MPNWTQNYVEIRGDETSVAEFKAFVKTKNANGEGQCFDFNEILPMPDALMIEAGSTVLWGLDAFANGTKAILAMKPNARQMTRQAILNQSAYGQKDWYDWCTNTWGTKWNACDAYLSVDTPEYLAYSFNTAWCGPEGIARAIRNAFPELDITWRCLNEDECSVENKSAPEDSEERWVCVCLDENPNTYEL